MLRDRGESPSWGITKTAATGTICIRFVGPTRTHEIPQFIDALDEMMPAEDANLIFDLRKLEGHNPETKEPIKAWLIQNKARITQVKVVVPKSSGLLKMVTAVIALATGVKIRIQDSVDDSVLAVNA